MFHSEEKIIEEVVGEISFDFSQYTEGIDIYEFSDPLMKEIFDSLHSFSRYESPLMAFSATLTLKAFLMRDIIQSPTGILANVMIFCVEGSGSGKSSLKNGILRVVQKIENEKNFIINRIGSYQGFLKKLSKNKHILLLRDEATYDFKAVRGKNATSYEKRIEGFKLELFSNPALIKSDTIKNEEEIEVENPFFSELSIATCDIFSELSTNDFNNGLMSRYLFFVKEKSRIERNLNFKRNIPEKLIKKCQEIRQSPPEERLNADFDSEETKEIYENFEKKIEDYANLCQEGGVCEKLP